MKQIIKYYSKVIISGVVICAVFGFTLHQFYHQSQVATNRIITEHIDKMVEIFKKIDATCGILHILHAKNYIDFLNVRSFSGSEVGSLNLAHPEKWQGPYLQDNFTMQGKLYEIVKAKSGFYLVPGQGVKLASGKVIGKDIVFHEKTDMEQLLNSKADLEYEGAALAAKLPMSRKVISPDLQMNAELYYDEDAM